MQLFQCCGILWREDGNFPGMRLSIKLWETNHWFLLVFKWLEWSGACDSCFPFNNAACGWDRSHVTVLDRLADSVLSTWCELSNSHGQTPSQLHWCWCRHRLHVWTYVCLHMIAIPTDNTTHADKWTHIPGKVVQVWKHGLFSVCNLLAVGVNVTHTWCIMHLAYGRRGWRKLSSPLRRCGLKAPRSCQCKNMRREWPAFSVSAPCHQQVSSNYENEAEGDRRRQITLLNRGLLV